MRPDEGKYSRKLKLLFIGKARDLNDQGIFHRLTLVAFFAWIGLGSDGLSSSCYGPEETFRALGQYPSLAIFVGIAIIITISIIATSYSQIIKLFPSGGGGYKVATKLLSPGVGMVAGSSLIVDYILTIAISIASGTDAIFSLLPQSFQHFKILVAVLGIVVLIFLNLRGIRESVMTLMPVFIIFVVTHLILILATLFIHAGDLPSIYQENRQNFNEARRSLGEFGILFLMMRAYSMGAGTYTGMEAVSNSVPILKEPRVRTGLITMRYMAISLGFTVMGLLIAYTVFKVVPEEGKTLNAVLLGRFTENWHPAWASGFIYITLAAEAALLFIAAQTGFLDGPRVIGAMAHDHWFPHRFTVLSDRLVTQNGILFMGISAIIIIFLTKGAVKVLVVLYSINVFITFVLSQAGMVRHWFLERHVEKKWLGKLAINGTGLVLTFFILISLAVIKFKEGGWITILITSALVVLVTLIRRHYLRSGKIIDRLNFLMFQLADHSIRKIESNGGFKVPAYNPDAKTAVVCVSGYNGLGIRTFFKVKDEFKEYRNIIFLEVGIVDTGNFRGTSELTELQGKLDSDMAKYENLARHFGFWTTSYSKIGTDVADEVKELSKQIVSEIPHAVFFMGQLVLPEATAFDRMLHNQTQLAIQNRLSHKGLIMVMVPVRIKEHK